MNIKVFILLVIPIVLCNLCAQATAYNSIDAIGVKDVIITLNHTFQLEIINTSENKVIINSVAEGEYQNKVLIKAQRDDNLITISDDLLPFSENYNDKLDAHKVISLKMKIQIPAHIAVHIQSMIGSLEIHARFKNLLAKLISGDCILNSYIGNATIVTTDGSIMLFTKNATVNAYSKLGSMTSEKISGIHQIELKSTNGDISIFKLNE